MNVIIVFVTVIALKGAKSDNCKLIATFLQIIWEILFINIPNATSTLATCCI